MSFNFPIICVGNLATGGTGKTPMTEYLVKLLSRQFEVATLSRGYKRKTRGFALAHAATTALEIGDEPMQLHEKFPQIAVAVGEERALAIPQLLQEKPNTDVIILDDAFQHRKVKAGLNILLTECNNLFTRDFAIPTGDLRDVRSSAERAEIIIVTKCPADLSLQQKLNIEKEIRSNRSQQIFFTLIVYGDPYPLFNVENPPCFPDCDVLLVCGIANPAPLKQKLESTVPAYEMMRFNDHHIFTSDDLKEIKKHFSRLSSGQKMIMTTEKDAVRLKKFKTELENFPVFVMPIEHKFLFGQEQEFHKLIVGFVDQYEAD